MSDSKELEIRLQFLDEALDYLKDIDDALIGIADAQIELSKIDSAMRAAHSIKGGASVMGFTTLSELSHRLEDALKVLKLEHDSLHITAEIEGLLLATIDCMHAVVKYHRQQREINQEWLRSHAIPMFDQLQELLGEPQEEEASSLLMMEEEQNIVVMLFQTEVEGCLQRLEFALLKESPCLQEEVTILAQELGGLAEMIQLDAFGQLCHSIEEAFGKYPNRPKEVALSALNAWRYSQDLVINQNIEGLPTTLDMVEVCKCNGEDLSSTKIGDKSSINISDELSVFHQTPDSQSLEIQTSERQSSREAIADIKQVNLVSSESVKQSLLGDRTLQIEPDANACVNDDTVHLVTATDPIISDIELDLEPETELSFIDLFDDNSETVESPLKYSDLREDNVETVQQIGETAATDAHPILRKVSHQSYQRVPKETSAALHSVSRNAILHTSQVLDETPTPASSSVEHDVISPSPYSHRKTTSAQFQVSERPDTTTSSNMVERIVRVPTKQLDHLSDLLGELIIERNQLNLELKTLQNLIQSLTHRSKTLNQFNTKLRGAYDTVATHSPSRLISPETNNQKNVQIISSYSEDFDKHPDIAVSNFNPSVHSIQRDLYGDAFDGLEMDRYGKLHSMYQEIMETVVQIQELTGDINLGLDDTNQTARELNKTTKYLQNGFTQIRMRPLSDIVDRFPRSLRELSLQYQKPVRLQIYGGNTLVDRNILEALSEPLLQLIRNAFDHGIESPEDRRSHGKSEEGSIEIRAFHRNNRTIIIIHDDGQGISLAKIRSRALQMGLDEALLTVASDDELLSLIFEPGFSTAEKVTSLSGRGVGMDIVRNKLRQIRGDIKVNTKNGQGTTFTISVPFTLSVARVLLAESNHMMLAFPIDTIEEMIPMQHENLVATLGSETFDWQGNMVQLIRLSNWLKFNTIYQPESLETPPQINVPTILMVTHNQLLIGVQVDRCWGEQEVAIRKVEGDLPLPTGFNSCTILGNGRVVPLVNISEMLHWIVSYDRSGGDASYSHQLMSSIDLINNDSDRHHYLKAFPSREPSSSGLERDISKVLVIDDSINVRRLLALAFEKNGYRVVQAKDGQDALEKLTAGLVVQAIICDIEMPRLDGFGFLTKTKALAPLKEVPVIMLTSRSGQKHRLLANHLGASAYFSKPYNERALLQTVEALVSPRSMDTPEQCSPINSR